MHSREEYRKQENGCYSGVPKFIVEILSPSTALRDRIEKKDVYEKVGV
ncbi:Uma2 family endonuclease [Lachnospiraceae bacterium 62-35]